MAARDDAGGGTGSARRQRESDASARTCVTSGWRSRWPLPRRQKTARAGREARDALHGHVPEARLPQGRVLRQVVGHFSVPALDVPVPQMVVQFFRVLSPDPEQVIEVPKILPFDVPMRAALRVTQLVEVPTTISFSSLQRTFLMVEGDSQVFKVFFPDRVQQRRPSCRSSRFSP